MINNYFLCLWITRYRDLIIFVLTITTVDRQIRPNNCLIYKLLAVHVAQDNKQHYNVEIRTDNDIVYFVNFVAFQIARISLVICILYPKTTPSQYKPIYWHVDTYNDCGASDTNFFRVFIHAMPSVWYTSTNWKYFLMLCKYHQMSTQEPGLYVHCYSIIYIPTYSLRVQRLYDWTMSKLHSSIFIDLIYILHLPLKI